MLPLSGTKTHPLSEHALHVLELLKRGTIPAQEVNAGVVNRLLREGCVELVNLPSPYKKGGSTVHLKLKAKEPQ